MDDVRIILLELNFNKYLQYKITTFLVLFTYIIALTIPFLTKQLRFSNLSDMLFIIIITSVVFIPIILLLNEFNYHLKRILEEIKKLD